MVVVVAEPDEGRLVFFFSKVPIVEELVEEPLMRESLPVVLSILAVEPMVVELSMSVEEPVVREVFDPG
jgi:hypothetical protein